MWTCIKVDQIDAESEPFLALVGFTTDEKEADEQTYSFASGNFTAPLFLIAISTADGKIRIIAWSVASEILSAWAWVYSTYPDALCAQFLPVLAPTPERGFGEKTVLDALYSFDTPSAANPEDSHHE